MSWPQELHALELALRDGSCPTPVAASRVADLAARAAKAERDQRAAAERAEHLRERAHRITAASGTGPAAAELLDAALGAVAAQRGFLGLVTTDEWSIVAARALGQADLREPHRLVSRTIIDEALETGRPVRFADASELGTRSALQLALRSVLCVPILHEGRGLGFLYLDAASIGAFDETAVSTLAAWLPLLSAALVRAMRDERERGLPGIVTRSAALQVVLDDLVRVAAFDAPVLLTGETGTGKSSLARGVHDLSGRCAGPFVHVNCGAVPEALFEAEMFGAEAGAYTGATARRIGRFEAASGGTLFLDEFDTMPLPVQVKLLVALQEGAITRLGANRPIPVNVRVVAAMSTPPEEAIRRGTLREDLYYRLAVVVAHVPPLRERPEDVPLLARHFLLRSQLKYKLPALNVTEAAERALREHDWPGNVRELENTLDRAALLSRDGVIDRIAFAPRAGRATGGAVAAIQRAADRVATSLLADPRLSDLDLGVLDGALMLALAERLGSRASVMERLGRGQEVAARNHHRTWTREVGRLRRLAERLGEARPEDPTEDR